MQNLLKYTSAQDINCQRAYKAVLDVIQNPNNVIEKQHVPIFDVAEADVFFVSSPDGEEICNISEYLVVWNNDAFAFPAELGESLQNALKQRVLDTKNFEEIRTNMFVAHMKKFTGYQRGSTH